MAFITTKEVAEKRKELRNLFPIKAGWKFSVTGGNSSSLSIKLMQYPTEYNFPEYIDINPFHFDSSCEHYGIKDKEKYVLSVMLDIALRGHWDKSDLMTDYFNCAYYYDIGIGQWNRPAVHA